MTHIMSCNHNCLLNVYTTYNHIRSTTLRLTYKYITDMIALYIIVKRKTNKIFQNLVSAIVLLTPFHKQQPEAPPMMDIYEDLAQLNLCPKFLQQEVGPVATAFYIFFKRARRFLSLLKRNGLHISNKLN